MGPARGPMKDLWGPANAVHRCVLEVHFLAALRVENSRQIWPMRMENYGLLGVCSHPNRQIL